MTKLLCYWQNRSSSCSYNIFVNFPNPNCPHEKIMVNLSLTMGTLNKLKVNKHFGSITYIIYDMINSLKQLTFLLWEEKKIATQREGKIQKVFRHFKHTSLLANSASFFWNEASSPRKNDELSESNIVLPSSLSYLYWNSIQKKKIVRNILWFQILEEIIEKRRISNQNNIPLQNYRIEIKVK